MAKQLTVAVEIADTRLAKSTLDLVREIPDIEAVQWFDSVGEKGPLAVKATPDVIIIDDTLESSEMFKRISALNRGFPQAAVFVISTDKRPGHIVEVMKAGCAEYLVAPVEKSHLQNAVEEIRTKLANAGKIARGDIYSFISSKGGLGATVLSVNTAVAYTQHNKGAVSFCDMSLQSGDSTVLLDLMPQTTIADICTNFHRLDVALLRGAMLKHSSGLEMLAAPKSPEEAEDVAPEHVESTLDLLSKLYDTVLVDCTSMFINDCTIQAFHSSEKIFIVTDLSVPAVRNASRLYNLVRKIGISEQKVEFVINRFTKGGILSLEEIEKTLGKRIFWLFPNYFDDVISSINEGIPLVKFHPHSPFSKNVEHFIEKLENPTAHQDFRGIRGAFGKAI